MLIATTPLPCSITLVITWNMYFIANLLIYYTTDIVGYPLAVLLTVPIAVIGYYFAAMVLAIVIPFWVTYHTIFYTLSRVERLIYPYGPYRHDRHNVLLCGHVDKNKMKTNKFKKILFLLLLFVLPTTSAPSPSSSISTKYATATVGISIAAVAATASLSGRGMKRKMSFEEEETTKTLPPHPSDSDIERKASVISDVA